MDISSLIQTIAISALPVIFAITVHEAAHGYAARHFGDNTAWLAGRISLNPLRHIELFGTILLPALLHFIGSPFLFGWAKPVPVNFSRLRNPKQDMFWVALAGPAVNLLMAIAWTALLKIDVLLPRNYFTFPLALMCEIGIGVNLALMGLNLLPLPPLDGGRIVTSLLPWQYAVRFASLERWGFFILLGLLYLNVLDYTVWPLVSLLKHFLLILFQLK